MTGVNTPDGIQYVDSAEDARDLIEQYVGYDLARYCYDHMQEVDFTKLAAKEKAETDEEAVMEENSELRDMIGEVQSMLQQTIYEEFDKKKRINRDKVYDRLNEIDRYIQKNL